MNIYIFSPLSGSPYIELSGRLRKSIGGLINIKNNDNKCFFRFLIRYLNALKIYPERIAKADENMVTDLDCKGIEFPVPRKHFGKIEKNNNIPSMCFVMTVTWFILFMYRMYRIENLKTVWIY